MPDLYVLMSHSLSPGQEGEARERFLINRVIYPPEKLKNYFSGVPPENELDLPILYQMTNWIQSISRRGDIVLVQGEYGITFFLVDFCLKNGLVPIYASSHREYRENPGKDGSVVRHHRFRHVTLRHYQSWKPLKKE